MSPRMWATSDEHPGSLNLSPRMWTGISASLNLPQSRLPNPALQVYCNQASVDDALVELLYRPSCDPGAIGVFVSVLTGQC